MAEKRPRTLLVAAIIVVTAGLGIWLALHHVRRAAERATVYLPTEADVFRSFPEARLPRSTFAGIWAERDRGTWIFEYGDANPVEAGNALKNALLQAGWVQRSPHTAGIDADHFYKRAINSHLLIREQPGGLSILIILSVNDDLRDDEFAARVLRNHWRADHNK